MVSKNLALLKALCASGMISIWLSQTTMYKDQQHLCSANESFQSCFSDGKLEALIRLTAWSSSTYIYGNSCWVQSTSSYNLRDIQNARLAASGLVTGEKQIFIFLHRIHLPLNFTLNFLSHIEKKLEPSKKLLMDY